MKKAAVAALLLFAAATPARASSPDFAYFGLQDVEQVARCVHRNLPAGHGPDFVAAYWGPANNMAGRCGASEGLVSADKRSFVRSLFLDAVKQCTGSRPSSDDSAWLRRVGYGTAVLVAAGNASWTSRSTLLDSYIAATKACQ